MQELTPELMTAGWHPVDVRLSPDGATVAWVAQPYGKGGEHPESAIWVAPTQDPARARRWTFGGADTSPRWAPDGTRLAFLSDRADRGTAGLYVMPATGGEARPVVVGKRPVGALAWSPDGERLAFLVADESTAEDERREKERDDPDVYGERLRNQHLRLIDVATGKVTALELGERHVAEVIWSPDGGRLACVMQATPRFEELVDREILVVRAGGDVPVTAHRGLVNGLGWSSGNRLVFSGSNDEGSISSGAAVWSIDPDGGHPARIATDAADQQCALSVRVQPGSPAATVLIGEGLTTRIEQLRDATGELLSTLHSGPGSVDAYDVADGVLALINANPDRLAEVYAGPSGQMRRLSDHHGNLAESDLPIPEAFTWRGADGTELNGVVMRPRAAGPGPLPTIVVPHGGPYARTVTGSQIGWAAWGTWLAGAGYATLLPNYRGSSGRGRDFALAARAGVGGIEFADVMSMVDAAIARGIADESRLGIGGWSQGGFLSAWAVTQTDRFRAAVVGAGPTDWDAMAATSDVPRFEAELAGSQPWDGPEERHAAERSPIRFARSVHTPVLILHGQNDERVPVAQAVGFHRALRAAGQPVELVTYPREPHGIAELAHQRDVLRRVRGWFDRWCRP